ALFACAHLEWQMFLPIGVVGVVLAFLRQKSGSIIPSFLLHASFNGASFVLMALSKPGASAEGAAFPRPYVAAAAALALALVGCIHLVARSAVAARAQEMDLR